MFEGKDFPSFFQDGDNFTSRRTTGHNLYDPESLLTGAEMAGGCDYNTTKRKWADEATYIAACTGQLEPEWIAIYAPRVFIVPGGYVHYSWAR